MKIKDTAAIILAAGMSKRMNSPKALLPFDARHTFIEKISSSYFDWGCSEIIVIVIKTASLVRQLESMPALVTLIINEHPEFERFYSLKLGLSAVKRSEYCFFQNVDNPFIDDTILDLLYASRSPDTYVSPVFEEKGGHPILLNRENMDFILNFQANDANLKFVMSSMDCKKVEMPNSKVLININCPEEYDRLFDLQ